MARNADDEPEAPVSLDRLFALVVLVPMAMWLLMGILIGCAWVRVAAGSVELEDAYEQVTRDPLTLGLAQLASLGAAVLAGVRIAYGDRSLRDSLGIAPVRASTFAFALAAGAALHIPLVELMAQIAEVLPAVARSPEIEEALSRLITIDGPIRALVVLGTFVVIAPVTEELLFRGLLQRALRTRAPAALAISFTALVFGLFHGEPVAIVYATLSGLLLGGIAERARSVLGSIAFHAGFNLIPFAVPHSLVPIPGLHPEAGDHVPAPLVALTAAACVASIGLLWLSTRRA